MRKFPANEVQNVPLNMVGSNNFGRYAKISQEETFNMIISDDALVPYAGYTRIITISDSSKGRGIFTSNNFGVMIVVIGNAVYSVIQNVIDKSLIATVVGLIDSSEGPVSIDENNLNQVAISDLRDIYIYNAVLSTFVKATESLTNPLDFIPGHLTFQNGRFLVASLGTKEWRLSLVTDGSIFPNDTVTGPQHVGEFESKPDTTLAARRFPGRGNLLFVFGSNGIEAWQDVGAQLFPYQRLSSFNIDYGCLNADTIASSDRFIVWLASNSISGPVIVYSDGSDPIPISTDGIDFKLGQLTNPSNSYAFLFKQDGHLIYQITWPDDKLSYLYDFNTKRFFTPGWVTV